MPLPSTILYPEAFRRNEPAGFDGVFDWDCLIQWERQFNPRSKIKPTDQDAVVERKGFLLKFETKEPGVPLDWAQATALKAETWPRENGDTRVVCVWGMKTKTSQAGPLQWQHIGLYGRMSMLKPCLLADVRGFYLAWRHCAERRDMSGLAEAYRIAKTTWRPTPRLVDGPRDQGELDLGDK